jgi:protein YibB
MNTTIVTSLYDIGRGKWDNVFRRSHEEYLKYFENVLLLDCNIIIYIDEKDLNTVQIFRSKIDPTFKKTKIVLSPFTKLEAFEKFYLKCNKVMNSDFFIKNRWENHTPEMIYPEYNIINFNKVSFLEKSIQDNWFNSEYFIWMDAGFYHSKFPQEYRYKQYPDVNKIKILDDNKIHFLTLTEEIELKSYFDPRVSITGSMFAGKAQPILKLKKLCFETIEEFLNSNAINDDQTIYAFSYMKDPNLFNLQKNDWFQNFYTYI